MANGLIEHQVCYALRRIDCWLFCLVELPQFIYLTIKLVFISVQLSCTKFFSLALIAVMKQIADNKGRYRRVHVVAF